MADSGLYGQCRAHAAIVGFCDLKNPNANRVLGMMRQSRNFVGVRCTLHGTDDADFMRGFALLEKHGLTYDCWNSKWSDIPPLAAVARAFPNVPIVLNHLGV